MQGGNDKLAKVYDLEHAAGARGARGPAESSGDHDGQGRPVRWDGGYIRYDREGRATFYIYKKIAGRIFEKSTRRHKLSQAQREYDRFLNGPGGPAAYDPRGENPRDAVLLCKDLIDEYLAFSIRPKEQGGAGNTVEWHRKQGYLLADWLEALGKTDLRRLDLATIRKHLKNATTLHHRISVIKGLYAWLRHEDRIKVQEDPTFGALQVPQSRAEQINLSKVIPFEHVSATVDQLTGVYRDALIVQVASGWHTTEIVRFSKTGSVREYEQAKSDEDVGKLVLPVHKNGEPHQTRASRFVMDAAKRLLEHGAISREWYDRAVVAAAKDAKVPHWTPGRLRHSVASWAIGDDEEMIGRVSDFLGHKSPRTTKKFYATWAAPKKIPTAF